MNIKEGFRTYAKSIEAAEQRRINVDEQTWEALKSFQGLERYSNIKKEEWVISMILQVG